MLTLLVASFIFLLLVIDMRQTIELQYRSLNLHETNMVINWLVNLKFTSYTQTIRIYFGVWLLLLIADAVQIHFYPSTYDSWLKGFWLFVACLELRCVAINWKNGLGY